MKLVLLIVFLLAVVTSVPAQPPKRTVAVTFDDLPYVGFGERDYLTGARTATAKILSTLKKHKVPAVGFVNERMLEHATEREARIALLRDWVGHGMILANHTYSHPDFNHLTVEQFQEEIAKGEVVTRELMKLRGPYQLYFRHPMTHTGDTREKKEAIEAFLAARGYKVTPHTIENSDFVFNVPYSLALQKGDTELARRLREAYLDFTVATTAFAENVSPQIFGREIPQLLLIHSNDITADCLDEILTRYKARGYSFVSLDTVMADPAYQTKDTYVTKHGPTWFVRWSESKGMDVSFRDDPDPPKWVMDLYRNRTSVEAAPAPVFRSDNPESIYAADQTDSWNRIFRSLFTRTVQARVSNAFPEGGLFETFQVRMGSFSIRLSRNKMSRFERGDRAIEPLYPTFFTNEGPARVLSDPLFSQMTTALKDAIADTRKRSPIERALMQADVWAAYDIIYNTQRLPGGSVPQRPNTLLTLMREFIRKLALTRDEINSLQNNYLAAVNAGILPNLFSSESGWLEVELLPHRLHDQATRFRRATRVFVKPRTTPADPAHFVDSLKYNRRHDHVEAVALIIQNLLIDTSGRVVPSPVFTDVQFRFFRNDEKTRTTTAEPQQFELSRRKLLTEPGSGGFVEYSPSSPAYLASAGNDYEFATPISDAGAPVVVPLRTRCTQCHNAALTTMMTYSIHDFPPVPNTRILKPLDHERAFYTARVKEERSDFKSLQSP